MLLVEIKRWFVGFLFSLLILALLLGYYKLQGTNFLDLFFFNKIIAFVGIFLIGISFSLGPLCHYFNLLDSKLIYRKYIGVLGALYGGLHIIFSVVFLSERFFGRGWKLNNWFAFSAAVIATFILTMMVLVSNRYAIKKLGPDIWKFVLRLGYLSYIFLLIHIIFLKYPRWILWFTKFEPSILPPSSLVASIFIVLVLLLRLRSLFDTMYSENEVAGKPKGDLSQHNLTST